MPHSYFTVKNDSLEVQSRDEEKHGVTLFLNIFKKHNLLTFVVMLGISFILSCAITTSFSKQEAISRTVAAAIMGDSRVAVSQHFFETADLYFHKGAEHIAKESFSNDIFQRTQQIVSPSGHFHIEHDNIKEMMPWLWLSIKMDPQNIETYLVTSFWLSNAAKKPNMALEVLKEAQLNNPYNYQVEIEKGRIYLKQGRLDKAKHAFDTALLFWTKTADQLNEFENMDRAEALLYRGLLAEHDNNTTLATDLYKEILTHFPGRSGIRDRISRIEAGKKPEIIANSYWNNILKNDVKNKSKCRYEEHQHNEDCHHEEEHLHDENCNHNIEEPTSQQIE